MELGPKEIIIIFNSKDDAHKEAIAYAHILSEKVKQYDVTQTHFSKRMLGDLARRLKVEIIEMLDVDGPLFHSLRLRLDRLDNESALALIVDYPELLRSPILLINNQTLFIKNKDDIMSLALA